MASQPFRVKAVFEYSSPHEDDLSFGLGQIITVTDEEDNDWYYGEFEEGATKKQGLFPRNFVERYEPTTPPRPSRPSRHKKEAGEEHTIDQDSQPPPIGDSQPPPNEAAPPQAVGQSEPSAPAEGLGIVGGESEASTADIKQEPGIAPPKDGTARSGPPLPAAKKPDSSASPESPPVSPPPQAPAGGSFKDRIAAFNKPTAPPVAPKKPGNLGQAASSGFVKKPYVAPPPSRNAYVPPPKDNPYASRKVGSGTESTASDQASAEPVSASGPGASAADIPAEQPKTTSLKDRIALLQQQQLEQAARHAEAAQKREKPKKPPKKSISQHSEALPESTAGEEEQVEETMGQDDVGSPPSQPLRRVSTTEEASNVSASAVPRVPTMGAHGMHQVASDDGEEESESRIHQPDAPSERQDADLAHTGPDNAPQELAQPTLKRDAHNAASAGDSEQEEEESLDPEIKRRMEIRDRMAKMSGGVGMAGMFGAPAGLPGMAGRKPKQTTLESTEPSAPRPAQSDVDVQHPVPLPGMSFPPRPKARGSTGEAMPVRPGPAEAADSTSERSSDGGISDPVDNDDESQTIGESASSEDRSGSSKQLSGPCPSLNGRSNH